MERDKKGRFIKGGNLGHKQFGGFDTIFKKGHKNNIGKRWKVKDSSKMGGKRFEGKNSYQWKGGVVITSVLNNRIRKERLRNANGSHTIGEWETLKAKYNWTCPCCKKSEPKIKLTKDHIIPITKGGSNNIKNIQPLCKSCNCKKHCKIIKYEKNT